MSSFKVRNGDVELHVDEQGEGSPVVLLHGWPDTSALWVEVTPDLLAAGYRVIAPDLRGCGASDKPSALADYEMHHLVGDVASVIESLGGAKVTLVGHDWGAALAWAVALFRPDLVERLVVVSVGHPTAFRRAGLAQQIKSWYTLLFSYEGVGEGFLRKNDYEVLRHWTGHPRPDQVIEELERDGQMSAHLKWYRANLPPDAFIVDPPTLPPVSVPVLGVWSSGDFALTEVQMTTSSDYCAQGFTYLRLDGFGHWVPLEAPHELASAIVAFASSSR